MQKPNRLNLLINVGAALTAATVVGFIAFWEFYPETVEPCSSRYPAPTQFALSSAATGQPLSNVELQGRAGLSDFGVADNASVVPVENGPAPEALEVQLRGVRHGADAAIPRNGIGFHWAPPNLNGAAAACVSYSAWIPEKFDYTSGGVLPGVFGGSASVAAGPVGSETLSVRPAWNTTGAPTIGIISEHGDRGRVSGTGTTFSPARWTRIEQEVVLNSPGKPDGIARLWIDDKLVAENLHLRLRENAAASLQGVLFTIGYSRVPVHPGIMRLSPLHIAWRK